MRDTRSTAVVTQDMSGGLYSPRIAARVARISYQRFQAWGRARLLHPRKVGRESIYTYKDLLLIRLIMRLRDRGFAPKVIRTALDTIRLMSDGEPDAWLKSAMYVVDRIIVAVVPRREEWSPVAASRGPQKMALVFFPELAAELARELVPERFRHVSIDPSVLAGAPVVKGTRVPTRAIALVSESGGDPQAAYPDLTREQIADAVAYEEFLKAA